MRTLNRAARALLTIIAAMAMVLGLGTAAFAEYPPTIGGDTSTPGTPGGGSSNPTPNPGGGSSTTPGTDNRVNDSFRLTMKDWSINLSEANGTRIAWSCPPKPLSGGDNWYATSVSWWYLVDSSGKPAGVVHYQCAFPPKPVDSAVTCSSQIAGTITNPKGPSSVRTLTTKTVASAWASDRTNPAKCANSLTLAVNAAMDDLGAYLVTLTGTTYPCTKRTYPGTTRPAAIVSCGGAVSTTKAVQGGVWCNGTVKWAFGAGSWNHTWDWSQCTGTTQDLIQCNTDKVPTVDGLVARTKSNPVQILDDANFHAFVWPKFNPTGVVSISNIVTNFNLATGSSPFRVDTPENDKVNQPFGSDLGFNPVPGDHTVLQAKWMHAGNPGQPAGINRAIGFDAIVKIKTVKVTTVNFTTMAISTTTVTKNVTATGINCQSPAGYVAVFRARNSTN